MPELHPFRAVVHAPAGRDVSDLLSTPYDVIGDREAGELRERHEHNSVRLALPAGSEPHARAGERLRAWLEEGVLERRPERSLYLYEQEYRHRGEARTRTAVVGALDLAPLGEGEVLPHEETHRGPKADRLALMEATGAQLSPVFLVARDPDGAVEEALEAVEPGPAVRRAATPDGQRHRLRELPDSPAARRLSGSLTRHPLLVADGHHRYETALALADRRPEWPGGRRVLVCVVGGRDPGLLVQPTHRTVTRPPPGGGWRPVLRERFELRPAAGVDGPGDAESLAASAPEAAAMVALLPGPGEALLLAPRPAALDGAGVDDVGREVASLVFSRLVLRAGHGVDEEEAASAGWLSYHRDPGEALAAAGREGAAFYLPPPRVEAVWRMARRGRRLPPKSTYFWPKLPTGLVYRDLRVPD